jgi:glycosyl transferase family 25
MVKKSKFMISTPMLDYFDQIYIINLENRQDRLSETRSEFEKISVDFNHAKIRIFKAIKPENDKSWPSAGVKGCYLSHLAVLKDAKFNRFERILILEDDVNFAQYFNILLAETIVQLKSQPWGIFYGGYRVGESEQANIVDAYRHQQSIHKNLFKPLPDTEVFCLHFVAITQATIEQLVDHLEKMMQKPMGDPTGGRMHVDGAYNWFRKKHTDIVTLLAYPQLADQRSSRTDIHALKWFDTLPIFKTAVSAVRKIKNHLA